MELVSKQHESSTCLCARQVEKMHPVKTDYFSELREWVQQVIVEAEKSKDSEKSKRFLRLLEDL